MAAPSWIPTHTQEPALLELLRSTQPVRNRAKILTAEYSSEYSLLITCNSTWKENIHVELKWQFAGWTVTQPLHQATPDALHHRRRRHLLFIHSSSFFQCPSSVKGQLHTVGHAESLMCWEGEENTLGQKTKFKKNKIKTAHVAGWSLANRRYDRNIINEILTVLSCSAFSKAFRKWFPLLLEGLVCGGI